jgi:hypothetical protein
MFKDFWGFLLIKDGVNYLLESSDESGEEIDIIKTLPFEAKSLQKISDKSGTVYYKINEVVPKRIREEQVFSPQEFVNNLCLLEHSNNDHRKLLVMIALANLWDRSYQRIATPPGFGKDSVVDMFNGLFGDCGTVESPTLAKLEDRAAVLKWLVCNEVVDITRDQWNLIQNFLLPAACHKNEVTKHSRAFKNVGEIIDVSRFSLSMFYNDIVEYPDHRVYFDVVTKGAVKDRFPAFRLHGKYTEDFNSMKHVNVDTYVKDNMTWYINMVRTFLFYRTNFHSFVKKFDDSKLMPLDGRDKTNIARILKVVAFYSKDQKEFDHYVGIINNSMIDYIEMLSWVPFVKKLGGGSTDESKEVRDQVDDQVDEYRKKLRLAPTSKDKIAQIKRWMYGDNAPSNMDHVALENFEKDIL